jgi:hypothetical protein
MIGGVAITMRSVPPLSAAMSLPDPRETPMNAVRVATAVAADGELNLTDLPCRHGAKTDCVQ